jgi:CubicO group peptidase (beta-lactamase class C family)
MSRHPEVKMRPRSAVVILSLVIVTASCDSGDGENDLSTDDPAAEEDVSRDEAGDEAGVEEEESEDVAEEDVQEEELPPDEFHQALEAIMEEHFIPGMAVCVIKDRTVVRCDGLGWANIEERIPVTPDTVFAVASVSKTMTATALMQMWEAGAFDLDGNVSDALDFPVANPGYSEPITYRHLFTHTSSIIDNRSSYPFYFYNEDPPMSLADLIFNYFSPEGEWYDDSVTYLDYAPGTQYLYSNHAVTLLGYLGEVLGEEDFAGACKRRIFEPLGMDDTSFRLADFPDRTKLATSYVYSFTEDTFTAIGHVVASYYPAASARSSARDLTRYVLAYLNGGELDGQRILEEATVEEMVRVQFPGVSPHGLIWFVEDAVPREGPRAWQYGQLEGVGAYVSFEPDTGQGRVVLWNVVHTTATRDAINAVIEEFIDGL